MHVLRAEPLRPYNSLALQARAEALVEVSSDEEVQAACRWAAQQDLAVLPLGEGSNIVLAGDLQAMVLRQKTRGIEMLADNGDRVTLRVAAGENWHQLVQWTLQRELYGLENLALIPGTVGAAPIQNIGAYGVELQSLVKAVHAVSIVDGSRLCLSHADCEFGYRDSVFKLGLRDQLVITAVDLQLSRTARLHTEYPSLAEFLDQAGIVAPTPEQVFDAVVSIRRARLPDPALEPNAGSFFKNPVLAAGQVRALKEKYPSMPVYPQADGSVKIAAAWLIDYCGWKGYREENIGIHPEHALVIVNYGSGSGERLLSLASEVAATVAETFGISLMIEPRVYG